MNINKSEKRGKSIVLYGVLAFLILLAIGYFAVATPVGPTVTFTANETAPVQSAAMLNTSGGSITTMAVNASAQNLRWKAYVGNVTGNLVLDNAQNKSIFEWQIANMVGEIYATRKSSVVNWSNVNCTWSYNGTNTVRDVEEHENRVINHTNPDDNVSATFKTRQHNALLVGTRSIATNSCYSIHTFVNDAAQSTLFEEVLLYDGSNVTNGNLIYATILEQNATGFDGQEYDFQMIVPENGASTWSSSMAYYFYVELV